MLDFDNPQIGTICQAAMPADDFNKMSDDDRLRLTLADRIGCPPHGGRVSLALLATRLTLDAIRNVVWANSHNRLDNEIQADSRTFLKNDTGMLDLWLQVAAISGRTRQ